MGYVRSILGTPVEFTYDAEHVFTADPMIYNFGVWSNFTGPSFGWPAGPAAGSATGSSGFPDLGAGEVYDPAGVSGRAKAVIVVIYPKAYTTGTDQYGYGINPQRETAAGYTGAGTNGFSDPWVPRHTSNRVYFGGARTGNGHASAPYVDEPTAARWETEDRQLLFDLSTVTYDGTLPQSGAYTGYEGGPDIGYTHMRMVHVYTHADAGGVYPWADGTTDTYPVAIKIFPYMDVYTGGAPPETDVHAVNGLSLDMSPMGHPRIAFNQGFNSDTLRFRKTDDGATWAESVLPFTGRAPDLVTMPSGRSIITVHTAGGALVEHVSDDDGGTWT